MEVEDSKLIFVHRFKESHFNKRKKYRKLLRQKKVELVRRNRDGRLYREINNEQITRKI